MRELTLLEDKVRRLRTVSSNSLNWQDNLPVQRLLDVVVSIIAREYIQAVKQNPDVFSP